MQDITIQMSKIVFIPFIGLVLYCLITETMSCWHNEYLKKCLSLPVRLHGNSFSTKSHCPGGGCLLVLLPFITSAAAAFSGFFSFRLQQSQWLLTSYFDKSGGYMLIPFNLAFLPRAVTGGRDGGGGGQRVILGVKQ